MWKITVDKNIERTRVYICPGRSNNTVIVFYFLVMFLLVVLILQIKKGENITKQNQQKIYAYIMIIVLVQRIFFVLFINKEIVQYVHPGYSNEPKKKFKSFTYLYKSKIVHTFRFLYTMFVSPLSEYNAISFTYYKPYTVNVFVQCIEIFNLYRC